MHARMASVTTARAFEVRLMPMLGYYDDPARTFPQVVSGPVDG